jgi:aminoglycoside phosphotransferase (APT) family kinase protein
MLLPNSFPEGVRAVLGRIDRVTYPPQGATAQVILVDCEHGRRAVKRCDGDGRFMSELVQEASMLRALAETNVPAPRCYMPASLLGDKGVWLVMDALDGAPLSQRLLDATPAQRAAMIRDFGATLAALHATPPPASIVSRYQGRPWLERRLSLIAFYLAKPQHFQEVGGTAEQFAFLSQYPPRPHPAPVLIHGDYTYDNILYDDDLRVTGLVDWGRGALGDPRYDVTLALQSLTEADDLPVAAADRQAFYEGYGLGALLHALTDAEAHYFSALYDFF